MEIISQMNKICTLTQECVINTQLLDVLFFDRQNVNEHNFLILETYANSIETLIEGSDYDPKYLSLILLLMNSKKILDKYALFQARCTSLHDAEIFLYQMIVQAYIPTDDTQLGPNVMPQLPDILNHPFDTNYITDIINQRYALEYTKSLENQNIGEIDIALADGKRIFNRICDIYTNEESKKEFFYQYHWIVAKYCYMITDIENIVNRYKKYFASDDVLLRCYIYQLLVAFESNYYIDKITEVVQDFIDKYEINESICDCILNDTYYLAGAQKPFAMNIEEIKKYIHNTLYNACIDTDVTLIENNSAKESFCIHYKPEDGFEFAIESFDKKSKKLEKTENGIYRAFKAYKNAEDKVDSQITKAAQDSKKLLIGDTRTEIIEGKKFSAIGLLKQILTTAGLFAFGPIKGLIANIVRYALKKETTISERRKIIMELQEELEMIDEKIEDAKMDGDREAKYAMMRTRTELKNAMDRIQYGLEADERSINTAKNVVSNISHTGKGV